MKINGPDKNPFVNEKNHIESKEPKELKPFDMAKTIGFAPSEAEPEIDIDYNMPDSVRDERAPLIFEDMDAFIAFMDKDGDGEYSVSEIKEAQDYLEQNEIVTVVINNEEFNLLTTNKVNIEGTESRDIVIGVSTEENDYIKTYGGDDIIITSGVDNIYSGEGEDEINGITDSEFCESMKTKYPSKAQEAYEYALENINNPDMTREDIESHIKNIVVSVNGVEMYKAPSEFSSMQDFLDFIDKDGDGKLSPEEQKEAKELFQKSGVDKLSIDGKEYNMIYGDNSKKTWWGFGSKNKINGTNGNDIIWGTEGNDKIKGKKGDDIIFGLGGNDKLKGGKGSDKSY